MIVGRHGRGKRSYSRENPRRKTKFWLIVIQTWEAARHAVSVYLNPIFLQSRLPGGSIARKSHERLVREIFALSQLALCEIGERAGLVYQLSVGSRLDHLAIYQNVYFVCVDNGA